MKSLFEIIDQVKGGGKPDYDELRYATLALDVLSTFDMMALSKLAEGEQEGKKPVLIFSAVFQHNKRFDRWKIALAKSPKEWVGNENDPDNPAYQKRRAAALKLFESVHGKMGRGA